MRFCKVTEETVSLLCSKKTIKLHYKDINFISVLRNFFTVYQKAIISIINSLRYFRMSFPDYQNINKLMLSLLIPYKLSRGHYGNSKYFYELFFAQIQILILLLFLYFILFFVFLY